MKNSKYRIIAAILITISLTIACETNITVDLPTPEEKLIVQGQIENNQPAFVFLSRNLGYFDPVNIPDLPDSAGISDYIAALETSYGLIYDSTIVMTITSGGITDTMKPSFTFLEFPYFGYQSQTMTGEPGNTYRLNITCKNKEYWAETSIPEPVDIDSVWFEFLPENDTSGSLGFYILDDANQRNFYTIESRVSGEQIAYYAPYFGSYAFDDETQNGDTIFYTPLLKGTDDNAFFQTDDSEQQSSEEQEESFIEEAYFDFGNTVNIKLSCIDKETFVFWMSLSRHLSTSGNPFTNPASLQSNINGENCDGIWAGYGSQITTVHIDNSLVKE